jgi:hypothetical protein
VNAAPGTLDTLKELADALGDDADFAATMTTALAGKVPAAEKGSPNGVGTLDADGKQPESEVPDRLSESSLSASMADALTAEDIPGQVTAAVAADATVVDAAAAAVDDALAGLNVEQIVFYGSDLGTLSTHHGTPAYSATGLSGGVLNDLDIADYLSSGGASAGTITTGTIEGFLTIPATGALKVALARDYTFWMGVAANGKPTAQYGNTGYPEAEVVLIGPSVVATGVPKHYALVFNNGAGTLYYDGARVATNAAVRHAAAPTIGLIVGGLGIVNTYDWSGTISDVRLSDVARYSGATYTVPTAPFTMDDDTVALMPLTTDNSVTLRAESYPPRPSIRAGLVKYKGPVEPTDWLTGDEWVQTP